MYMYIHIILISIYLRLYSSGFPPLLPLEDRVGVPHQCERELFFVTPKASIKEVGSYHASPCRSHRRMNCTTPIGAVK